MSPRKAAPRGSLKEYHRKRDFAVTPEPRGAEKKGEGRSFVVQKHAASHLHYDFRLELEGVLKSWAVPKGPSLDPADKRLAMEVEDHPIEYGGFEGIIPKGQYGGGTVMIWDRGTWEPAEDPHAGYRDGKLVFSLDGEKLKGRFHLVRTRGRDRRDEKRSWLLFKEKDAEARPGFSVAEEMPLSATTGRSMEEIAADEDRIWDSRKGEIPGKRKMPKRAARVAARPAEKPTKSAPAKPARETGALAIAAAALKGARKGALPKSVQAQLPTLVDAAPDGDGWLHELKLDGYRILARKDGAKVTLLSRNGLDWTSRMRSVAEGVAKLPARTALLDGEVVVLGPDGRTSFNALQNVFELGEKARLTYFVFDLLHLDGVDVAGARLDERKALLAQLVEDTPEPLRYGDHVAGGGPRFFEAACGRELEGIVSKRRDCPYAPGRGKTWLKVKCHREQEAVIGGFTEPSGSREGLGALLLGLWEGEKLVYAGKVGTGFTQKSARELRRRLDDIETPKSPFVGTVREKGSHWVKPELVAQVRFGEWTPDHRMRHPSFLGLRIDKPAKDVVEEKPERRPDSVQRQSKKLSAAPGPAPKFTHTPKKGEGEEIAGVRITNGDRVLYPEQGVTKRDLARYYEAIAEWVVPHLVDRPTTLVRCPEGLGKECFYQKHSGTWAPASLRRALIPENRKTGEYLIVDDIAGVVGLVQIGVLEIHTWNSTVTDLEKPDRLVFDLDPDEGLPWAKTVEAARLLREGLETLGLTAFVKTTGGKGLHVVTPLVPDAGWEACVDFSRQVVTTIEQARPDDFVTNMRKVLRKGKIFLDYLRNVRGSTSVAAYSTRARPGAPVSVPLAWEELGPKTTGDRFTIANVPTRLASLKVDPWADYERSRVKLPR